jgi:hypothetical protein
MNTPESLPAASKSKSGKSRGLRTLLLWVVLASVLPVFLAIPGLTAYLYQRERADLDQALLQTTRALLQAVDGHLIAAQNGLELLAGSEELRRGDLAQFYKRGNDLVNLGFVHNVVLLDETGQQLMNTLQPFGQPLPKTGHMARFPPRQNSCRPDMILNLGAIRTKDGTVRRSIQEQDGGAAVAAGERRCRCIGERDRGVGADIGTMA